MFWTRTPIDFESGFTGPLDSYTSGLEAAYSTARRLLASYTGSLIRIRRSSDDAELDIGYDANGDLDSAAASTFAGVGSAYIVTVYDQTGSYDLTQSTAGSQPSLILSGTLQTINDKPTANYANDKFIDSADYLSNLAQSFIVAVSPDAAWGSYHQFLDRRTSFGVRRGGIAENGNTTFHSNVLPVSVRRNGVGLSSPFDHSPINSAFLLTIGHADPTTPMTAGIRVGSFDGDAGGKAKQPEVIVYSTANGSTARDAIEANIIAYYGIS